MDIIKRKTMDFVMCGNCGESGNGSGIGFIIGAIFGFLFGWVFKLFGPKKSEN